MVVYITSMRSLPPSVTDATIDTRYNTKKGIVMSDTAGASVIIYSAPWCAFCKTEKQYLEHLGVAYTERDIEEDDGAMDELLAKVGGEASSVPVTDIDGVIIRGFDRAKIDATLKEKGLIAA